MTPADLPHTYALVACVAVATLGAWLRADWLLYVGLAALVVVGVLGQRRRRQ